MIQLVIKNGVVLAYHDMEQNLDGKYPGAEIICYAGPVPRGRDSLFAPDPRLSRDPNVQLRRPPSRVVMFDENGDRCFVTVGGDSILRVEKDGTTESTDDSTADRRG